MLHIFVHVVRSPLDPFTGLKMALASIYGARIIDIRFDDNEYEFIDHVEYSDRRFLRAFFYPAVFRSLHRKLDDVLANLDKSAANVYFSDEGVWAVFWADYRQRLPARQVQGVNVQHGFALPRRPRFGRLRRLINGVTRLITGYPTIGYGSLGGGGSGPFEIYLTYDEKVAAFIRSETGCRAFAVPRLIKHELFRDYVALEHPQRLATGRVLFAMNINMRGSPVKCDVARTYDVLVPLASALREIGGCLVLRLHPGMDRDREERRFAAHPIARLSELDGEPILQASMAKATVVMSFISTVLWEGGLLGLLPVQLVCSCCEEVELGYEREILTLGEGLKGRLMDLLDRAGAARPRPWQEMQSEEWTALRPALVDWPHSVDPQTLRSY